MTPYQQMKKRHLLEELMMIEKAIIEENGHRKNAAFKLGMSEVNLNRKIKQHMQGEEYHELCKIGYKSKNNTVKKKCVKNTTTLEQIKETLYNHNVDLKVLKETRRVKDENCRPKEVEVYYTEHEGKKVYLSNENGLRTPETILDHLEKRGIR